MHMNDSDGVQADGSGGPGNRGDKGLDEHENVATFPPPEIPEPIKTDMDRPETRDSEPTNPRAREPLTVAGETTQEAQDRIDTDAR